MTRPRSNSLPLDLAALTADELAAAPRFRMSVGESKEHGVSLVSFVERPAIQRPFVALSAQKPSQSVALRLTAAYLGLAAASPAQARRVHLSTSAESEQPRQVLTGPVLVPDEEILRLDENGQPFFIKFDVEGIEQIARRYAASGYQTESNDEHALKLAGNVFFESWLVLDPANDKAAALGLNVPAGTWMLSAHIPDSEYWEKEIVSGNRTGFSLEGLFDSEQLTLSAVPTHKPMKKISLWARMFGGTTPKSAEALALQAVTLEDDSKMDVAEDGTVSLLDDEGSITGPAADGEYKLKDGTTLTVKDGKKVEPVAAAEEGAGDVAEVLKVLTAAEGETDAAKLLAAIKKAIQAAGGEPKASDESADNTQLSALALSAKHLVLEAVEMADGRSFQYNPITRRLLDDAGQIVQSGDFACADGSCFRVNTEQYTWQISKEDYAKSAEAATALAQVQEELTDAKTKLAATPQAPRVSVHGDKTKLGEQQRERPLRTHERYALAAQA